MNLLKVPKVPFIPEEMRTPAVKALLEGIEVSEQNIKEYAAELKRLKALIQELESEIS